MKYVLGIDVGGTSIKAGIFTLEGQLKAVRTIPTSDLTTSQAFAEVTDGLTNLVSSVDGAITDVEAVGLDIPGPVDANGNVGFLPNIKLDPDGLKNALKETFFQARLAFVNDANAAALGEMWMGGAKGVKNFIMITLGTGVGGGVVLNGQLVAGANGAGGELGHLTMNYEETRACGCGRHGCLEQYASASGIVTLYKEACEKAGKEPCALSGRSDSYSVFKAMAAGDECARTAISQMLEYLARAMAQLSCAVDPEAFVIGGGVVGSFDVFKDELTERFQAHCLPICRNTKIVPADLGNQAGMYGAALCALSAEEE